MYYTNRYHIIYQYKIKHGLFQHMNIFMSKIYTDWETTRKGSWMHPLHWGRMRPEKMYGPTKKIRRNKSSPSRNKTNTGEVCLFVILHNIHTCRTIFRRSFSISTLYYIAHVDFLICFGVIGFRRNARLGVIPILLIICFLSTQSYYDYNEKKPTPTFREISYLTND